MGSLENNHNQKNNTPTGTSPHAGVEATSLPHYGGQFLEAVREADVDAVCRLAKVLTSSCRTFSASVPSLTRGLFDDNASVRSNAAYLLSEGLHWTHSEDLNAWVLPSIIRALGTLDAHGPLIWLSKKVGLLANQISDQNVEELVSEGVRAFQTVDIEAVGLVALAPFGNRLEKNVRRNALETVCDVLQARTKLFTNFGEGAELEDRDPLRMMLPSVGAAIVNFTSSGEHIRTRVSDFYTQDITLMERLESTAFQYLRGLTSYTGKVCHPLSVEDKSVLLPLAASMGNLSLEWNAIFSHLEQQMHNQKDSFSTVLCRLTGGRRIADPRTVITQARNELLHGQNFLIVVSTLENAHTSLNQNSLPGRRETVECLDLLQEIQELTQSSYVAFFAQRVKEAMRSI